MWLRGRQCGKLTALLGQKDRSLGFGPVLVEELGEFDEKLRPRVRPHIYTHFISQLTSSLVRGGAIVIYHATMLALKQWG